jgi:hypothetical protein
MYFLKVCRLAIFINTKKTACKFPCGLFTLHATLLFFATLLKEQKLKQKMGAFLKVHKRENFLGSDFEICTFP